MAGLNTHTKQLILGKSVWEYVMHTFRFSGFIDPLSVRPQAGSWLWEDLVWFLTFWPSRIEESVKHDTTRVVPRCKYGGGGDGRKILTLPCLFVFYPLRSTEIGYPWPNIPCPGIDDGWMALFGVTRLIILIIGLLCYYFLSIFFKLLWLFPTALALVTNRVPCHFVRYTV